MHFIPLKKETSNYAFASFALLHLFFNSNPVSFVKGGCKNISCSRAQDILATPLPTIINIAPESLNNSIFPQSSELLVYILS